MPSPSRSATITAVGAPGHSKAPDAALVGRSANPEDLMFAPRMRITPPVSPWVRVGGPRPVPRTRQRQALLSWRVGEAINGAAFLASLTDHRIAALAYSRD